MHLFHHQFGIATKGGCKFVVHGNRCAIDLHLDYVVLQINIANLLFVQTNDAPK